MHVSLRVSQDVSGFLKNRNLFKDQIDLSQRLIEPVVDVDFNEFETTTKTT